MFPKNKVNIIYRLLCLISYVVVLLMINSYMSQLILFIAFGVLAICERNFRNIELIVITVIILGICYLFNNYLLFRIMLSIDYAFYFLDSTYSYEKEEIKINKNEYVRFKKNSNGKKEGSNNITAVYLTVHLGILFLAIMVG